MSRSEAAILESVTFPDTVKVGTETLNLNGTGLRTATMFRVKVYAAGLYLKNKTQDEKSAISASSPKQLQMQFLRNVDASDIREAWDKSFKNNCEQKCETYQTSLDQLKGFMPDMKKGERISYTLTDDCVSVAVDGKAKGEASSPGFGKVILSTWIGKNPPNEGLKEGLLGRK